MIIFFTFSEVSSFMNMPIPIVFFFRIVFWSFACMIFLDGFLERLVSLPVWRSYWALICTGYLIMRFFVFLFSVGLHCCWYTIVKSARTCLLTRLFLLWTGLVLGMVFVVSFLACYLFARQQRCVSKAASKLFSSFNINLTSSLLLCHTLRHQNIFLLLR